MTASTETTGAATPTGAARAADTGVRYVLDGHVAWITLDRPAVLNALDARAEAALTAVWEGIEADPQVRVAVLTGAGERSFCTGADMSAAAVGRTGLEYWAARNPDGFGGLSMRESLPVPVIARVNGYALGGGMEMVLGADIVIAAENAVFGLTEPRVGRMPLDGGIAQLVRRVPHTQAMGMLLTGRKVSAAELFRMGLVNEVVPAAELDAAVQRWVDDVLACAPTSIRAIKQMVQSTGHLTARQAQSQRSPELMAALDSADSREGLAAFQQKRPPQWTGR
jgi:crotonobetainyl-CoA hydratase